MAKYLNNPIIEALCEFCFISREPWDITIAGLIYQEIKEDFPKKAQDIGFEIKSRPTERGIEQKIESAPPRIRFISHDEKRIIQILPNKLIINQLRPYPDWECFKNMIMKNFNVYLTKILPSEIVRIGLRYINKIYLPEGEKLEEYFNFYPFLPKNLPQKIENLDMRVEISYDDREKLILSLKQLPFEKDHQNDIPLILDLDYISIRIRDANDIKEIEDYLNKANYNIYHVFEECLTEKCKNKFL